MAPVTRFRNELAWEMVNIDQQFHANDSALDWNTRLRDHIDNGFFKWNLSENEWQLFKTWAERVAALPANASRIRIFESAPIECLFIVGL